MVARNKIIKTILISLLCLLASTHILSIITKGLTMNSFTLVIVAFFIVGIYRENKMFYSVALIVQSIHTTLGLPELTEISPFIFSFLGLYYFRKRDTGVIIIPVILIFSFLLSYIVNDFCEPINLIEGIMGNLFLLFVFYFMFLKQSGDIHRLSKTTPLTRRQLLILRQIDRDIPRKKIPGSVKESELWSLDLEREHFTLAVINTEISRIKNKLDINSEFCLGAWYREKIDVKK